MHKTVRTRSTYLSSVPDIDASSKIAISAINKSIMENHVSGKK
ncbi:MAG: hypothetical protein BWX58_01038 [Deltaproteobacteria bacterium ADurb.Bin026]|nr:MAG: hypothetical protein BWX58_01038 [Deltaproteobacteria bacterium ADurb.Bin026]